MLYVAAWLRAFAFTQIVEAPLYRRALGVSWLAAFGASALTHPFVWFVFPRLGVRTAGAEIFAWLVEALWFFVLAKRCSIARALVVAFAANAASEGLGLLSRGCFGGP